MILQQSAIIRTDKFGRATLNDILEALNKFRNQEHNQEFLLSFSQVNELKLTITCEKNDES